MAAPALSSATRSDTGSTAKYLTFVLDREAYAFPVLKVREIIRLAKITPVAQMPGYVRGVMNLRGSVIPIIDLRMKFNLAAAMGERTCIVVVHVQAASKAIPLGLIVDAVDEVAYISEEDIQPTPPLGGGVNADYLVGIAKVRGDVKLLLDVDRLLAAGSIDQLAPAA